MCFRLRSCCCGCTNLQQGTTATAIVGLIWASLGVLYSMYYALAVGSLPLYVETKGLPREFYELQMSIAGLVWLYVAVNCIPVIVNALCLYGSIKRQPGFMIPWLIGQMIYIVLIGVCMCVVLVGVVYFLVHGQAGGAGACFVCFLVYTAINALFIYLFHVVFSYIKELKEDNRGEFQAVPMSSVPAGGPALPPSYAEKA